MMKIVVRMTLQTTNDADMAAVATELRRRIETEVALASDKVKAISVTSVTEDAH